MRSDRPTHDEIEAYHRLRDDLMRRALLETGVDPEVLLEKSSQQSALFMVEIIPIIHKLYFDAPANIHKTVLDIGPQTFAGTELLQRLHGESTFCQLKLDVTGIDIHDKFDTFRRIIAPSTKFIKGNVFDLDREFDLIICSHVIEHVPDPIAFIARLKAISRDHLIVACPWNEEPLTTKGHVNSIDKAFVRRTGATGLQISTNFMWGKQREVCIFWYSK
jgi:2-polyprenyl-3-methyl-5-hydroxy-6-metoxy-1,4-benzoquinol methylase